MNLPGAALFFAVAEIIKANPVVSFAEISAILPAELAKKFVPEEIRSFAAVVPPGGIKQEFCGVLNKIRMLADEQAMEVLLSKAKLAELSAAEKIQLQQLFLKKDSGYVAE